MSAMTMAVDPVQPGARAPAIEARGLRKTYRGAVAVDAVDLAVAPGSVVGLLGPNGAGKTTLIRMLSTVLRPDAGDFTVAGVPHTRPAAIRARIGVLPESAGYPGSQTCREWLTYHARLFGAARDDARATADRLLTDVGLTERRDSLISGLSRGMRQRLGIARALVNEPELVFLDEPTLGLDPRGQRQILDLVTRISGEHGVTVLLSTHLLDEVEQVCDRVVILNRGRVVADGRAEDVVRQAAAPRRGTLTVPDHLRARAVEVLEAHRFPAAAASNGHRPQVELQLPGGQDPETSAASALGSLLDAGVPVLGFSLEGGRLSDAFLAVTSADSDE